MGPDNPDTPGRAFRVCTIVNDAGQYAAMRRSFEAAGFDDRLARFTVFDNTAGNLNDPYAAISGVSRGGPEPYVIFCHQDVRLDRGATAADLLARLGELGARCARWAVAGNAGVTAAGGYVAHITDPHGEFASADLPAAVCSLDENFLVIRAEAELACSTDIGGFHLYATDLCMNALSRARTCHVIDFHVTHLSGGNPASAAFRDCLRRFEDSWTPRVFLAVVDTITGHPIRLSCRRTVRKLLSSTRVSRSLRRRGVVFVPAGSARFGCGFGALRASASLGLAVKDALLDMLSTRASRS